MSNSKLKGLIPLSVEEFKIKIEQGHLLLDTRKASEFTQGFISGSLFIGLEAHFNEWAKSLLSAEKSILFVATNGEEEATASRLATLGFNKIEGYLKGGFQVWKNAGEKIDLIIDIEPDELAMDIPFDENLLVLDVRRPGEFAEGHVKDALNLPLNEMTDLAQIASLEENQNIYIHGAAGYRSIIAASLLKKHGYHNVRNVSGGWAKIKEQKEIPIEKEGAILN